jgi:opacity protein-like surface antigen
MVCLSTAPSFAETAYLEYALGVTIVPNQNLTGTIPSSAGQSGSYRTDAGYMVGAAVGMPFLEYFRAEIALAFRSAEISEIAVQAGPDGGNGEITLFSAIANGYVDYDFGLVVVPYVGFGIGYGRLKLRGENTGGFKIRDKASVFVWNLMVGGTLPVSDTVDMTAEYRYLSTTDPDFESLPLPGDTNGSRYDSEYDNHEFVLGMRIKF